MFIVTSPLMNHTPSVLPVGDSLLSAVIPCPSPVFQAACMEPSPMPYPVHTGQHFSPLSLHTVFTVSLIVNLTQFCGTSQFFLTFLLNS